MGLFDWVSGNRQSRIADPLWQKIISAQPYLDRLAVDDQNKLKKLVDRFLEAKEFSPAGGLVLTDEICLSIAAQGCLPILHLGLSAYDDWVGIVVYPDEFVVERQIEDEFGVIHEYSDVISGEAWEGGPLLVSWQDVQSAGNGYNVVIHEFAHKLDLLNGEADGIPMLHSGLDVDEWQHTLLTAYHDFCRRVDAGEETDIDPYAAENPAEFFAVLTECFFEIPDTVDREYPAFFNLLTQYFRQIPHKINEHKNNGDSPC